MRNTLPASLLRPEPSDMLYPSSTVLRNLSASCPGGISTAVSTGEYSAGSRHNTSRPQCATATRVAAARRWWRAKTATNPPSSHNAKASRRPEGTRVAGDPRSHPPLEQHREGFAQAVEQGCGRRVGEEACRIGLQHLFPVPVRPRHPVGLRGGAGLLGDGVEAEPRRQHKSLLRAADRDVDLPLVVPVIDRA